MKEKFSESGWLLINKPEGIESFGVIRQLKYKYQFHKIGFAGTLDPLASGLLLIGINKATKKITEIHQRQKKYEMEIRFGASTPTLDAEGRFNFLKNIEHKMKDRIQHLKKFVGNYQQKIPNFSAHKSKGKNFYELARNNEVIEERFKSVNISSIKILYSDTQHLGLEIDCQTGFYVRAFAEELAISLGDIAYTSLIKRLKIGDFKINQSTPFEKVLDFSSINDLHSHLIAI